MGCLQSMEHLAVRALGLEKNDAWRQKQVNNICMLNLSIREKYCLFAKHSSKSKMGVDRACSDMLTSTQQWSRLYMFCEVLLTNGTGDPCWCTSTAPERAVRCCWQQQWWPQLSRTHLISSISINQATANQSVRQSVSQNLLVDCVCVCAEGGRSAPIMNVIKSIRLIR